MLFFGKPCRLYQSTNPLPGGGHQIPSEIKKRPVRGRVFFLAQKEGFEPSRAFYTPTPLAGEPLRPLGYFCRPKHNTIKLPNYDSIEAG